MAASFEPSKATLAVHREEFPYRHVLRYARPGAEPLLLHEVVAEPTADPTRVSRDYRVTLERRDSGLFLRVVVQEIVNDGHHYPNAVVRDEALDVEALYTEALAATKPEPEPEGNVAGVGLDLAGRVKGGALVAPRAPSLGGARPPARRGGSHVLALPLALLVAACPCDASATTVLRLGSARTVGVDWALSNRNGSIRAAARVPGCAHTDLLAAGVIGEPNFGRNTELQRWVASESFSYGSLL